jgi:aromatic-L-amino-acid decarboxylase
MTKSSFDLTPEQIRQLGYMAADAVAEQRAGLTSRPVFGKVGAGAAAFDEPPPEDGQPIEKTLAFAREHILPFPMGNSHPRFYGFINATADPVGIAADYLAASMNPNCWGGDHAAIHVEHRVMRWLAEFLGYPETAEGILVSGG